MAGKLAGAREQEGRPLDSVQARIARVERAANACPFLVGTLRSVRFPSGATKVVDHGLGTQATFIVVRTNYDGTGTAATATEAASQAGVDLRNQLNIQPSGACTLDLWFYVASSEAQPR